MKTTGVVENCVDSLYFFFINVPDLLNHWFLFSYYYPICGILQITFCESLCMCVCYFSFSVRLILCRSFTLKYII